ANILHGVVLIDIEVALGFELEIEATVMGEEFQHVIEETDSSRNLVPAAAFNDQHSADVGLLGGALNRGSSHFAVTSFAPISASDSRSARSNWAVCSVVPSVMRTQPSQ